MKIILLSGKAHSGKDTIATIIKDRMKESGYKVMITHYADLLKYICKEYFCWNGEKDTYGRSLIQRIGTDVVRNKYPNFWVDFIIKIIECFPNEWDYVIIPDCRFPNEIDELIKHGFHVVNIKVIREFYDDNMTEEQRSHISETALDGIEPDYFIDNCGDLHDLERTVGNWLEDYLNGDK